MERSFDIGVTRKLLISLDGSVVIKDTQSSAEAVFTKPRWSTFIGLVNDIDFEVKKLKENVNDFRYCQHYGAGWQASVTAGIRCVDLRRFYLAQDGQIRPTRHGIGLRLHEWQTLKNIIDRLLELAPEQDYSVGCFHLDLENWFQCEECFPFLQDRTVLKECDSTNTSKSTIKEPGQKPTTEKQDEVRGC
jgi:hypothetical protein